MKKLLTLIALIIFLPNISFGAFGVGWNATSTATSWISPNRVNGVEQAVRSTYFIATSTTATSTFVGGLSVGGTSGLNVYNNGNTTVGQLYPNGSKFSVFRTPSATAGNYVIGLSYAANQPDVIGFRISPTTYDFNIDMGFGGVYYPAFTIQRANPQNVGIGTSSPNWKLSVAGIGSFDNFVRAGYFTATSTTATSVFGGNLNVNNFYQQNGMNFVYASSTNFDTFLGIGAGGQGATTSATAGYNTAVGYNSQNAMGSEPTAIGNTSLGYKALSLATSTFDNTAIGYMSMPSTKFGGVSNTAIGSKTLYSNTIGYANVALGVNSLFGNINGIQNMGIGTDALYYNTSGLNNVGIGYQSALHNTTGQRNVAVGLQSLYYNDPGSDNIAIGAYAGYGVNGVTSSNENIFIGYNSGQANTGGRNNTFIGSLSGYNVTSGLANIAIGQYADVPLPTGSGQLNIGNVIYGTGLYTNTVATSTPVAGKIGIGTTSPYRALSVYGSSDLGTNALAGYFTATTTTASTLPYASTTAVTVGTAAYMPGTSIWTSDGKVGIGTSTPNSRLEVRNGLGGGSVSNGTFDIATFENNNIGYINLITPATNRGGYMFSDNVRAYAGMIYTHGDTTATYGGVDSLNFVANTATKMVITSTGNVGIGTTTPNANLQVDSATATSTMAVTSHSGTKGGKIILTDTNGTTCTEITTLAGAISSKAVTCP